MATNTGRFVWYEHLTKDPKAAIAFYTESSAGRRSRSTETTTTSCGSAARGRSAA